MENFLQHLKPEMHQEIKAVLFIASSIDKQL